MKAQKMW